MTIRVGLDQWGVELRKRLRADVQLAELAARNVAAAGVGIAVQITQNDGVVDRGQYVGAWRSRGIRGGAELRNDSPHAAVIEYGRRPGAPGPPIGPILAWVRRKIAGGQMTLDVPKKKPRRELLSRYVRTELASRYYFSARGKMRQERRFGKIRQVRRFAKERYRPSTYVVGKDGKIQQRRPQTMRMRALTGLAFVIARKIHRDGSPPHAILRGTMNRLGPIFKAEAIRALRRTR